MADTVTPEQLARQYLIQSAENMKSSIIAGCTTVSGESEVIISPPAIGSEIGTIKLSVAGREYSPSTFRGHGYVGADLYWLLNFGFHTKKNPGWFGYDGWIPSREGADYFYNSVLDADLVGGVTIRSINEPTTWWW